MSKIVIAEGAVPPAPAAGNQCIYATPSGVFVQDAAGNAINLTVPGKATEFVVGHDAGDPYSTISSAITAAVDAGHNHADPAIVLVKSGPAFVEDVTMAPGVHLIGQGGTGMAPGDFEARSSSGPFVAGKLIVPDLSPSGDTFPGLPGGGMTIVTLSDSWASTQVSGIRFYNTSDVALEVTGVSAGLNPSILVMDNCLFESGVTVVDVPNGLGLFGLWLVGRRTVFSGKDNVLPGFFLGNSGALYLWDCTIINEAGVSTTVAFEVDAGYAELHTCAVWQKTLISSTGYLVGDRTTFSVDIPDVDAAIEVGGSGFADLRGCSVSGDTFGVKGTGMLMYDQLGLGNFGGGVITLDPGLSISPLAWDASFTPTTPADWVTPPESIQEALDEVADGSIHLTGKSSTIDATLTHSITYTLLDDTAYQVVANVVGRRSDAFGNAIYRVRAVAYREAAGVATLIAVTKVWEEETDASWDATITASGDDIRVTVTGAAMDIDWTATATLIKAP